MGFQETFRALGDVTRRRILDLLKDGRHSAGEIVAVFKLSNATISHHLAVLKEAGLVSEERQGKFIYYELRASVLEEVMSWLLTLQKERAYETLRMGSHRLDAVSDPARSGGADASAGTDSDALGCGRAN